MKALTRDPIMPHPGVAFENRRGQLLKVTAPEDEQISALLCYNLSDPDEWLCNGRTFDHTHTWLLSKEHTLYSNRSNPMFTLLEDTCGRHDFLMAPCSQHTFEIHNNKEEHHHSCHENLFNSLMGWDIDTGEIYTPFSLFMNIAYKQDGTSEIGVPASIAGDYVLLRAELDMNIIMAA